MEELIKNYLLSNYSIECLKGECGITYEEISDALNIECDDEFCALVDKIIDNEL